MICILLFSSAECTVTVTNIGQVPVEMIEVSVQSALDNALEKRIFKWSDDNLKTQLPLLPGANASFTLYLFAATEFIAAQTRNGKLNSILHLNNRYILIL